MEDKLEALIVAASIVYAVVTYGKNSPPISTPNKKEVAGMLAGLALVSVIVLALFNTGGPSYAESKKDVLIWSYNIHQASAYRGNFQWI